MKKNVYVLMLDEDNPVNHKMERFKSKKEYEGYYKKTPGIIITGIRQLNKLKKEYAGDIWVSPMLDRINFD